MSIDSKPSAKTAAEICKCFPLSPVAAKLLADNMQPASFLKLLMENQHFADAVRFLAHTMTKREAVWWACVCIRPGQGVVVPPPAATAQQAVEAWVVDPSEAKRRAAHAAAEGEGLVPPAKLACEAAFFSDGSMGPAEHQPVLPPENLAATTAANAIILAAVVEPAKMTAKYGQFLAVGQEVAAGKNRWKQ
jgi:hypothetical protein